MGRNATKAQALADQIGDRATVGTFGATPTGDIVIVAVLYAGAVEAVAHYGEALSGKILVDITNPFNADATGLVTTAGDSMSQRIAAAAPEDTRVVKAFNTILQGVIAEDKPVDVFFAGDSAERRNASQRFWRAWTCGPSTQGGSRWLTSLNGPASSWWAWHATAPASTSRWEPKRSEGAAWRSTPVDIGHKRDSPRAHPRWVRAGRVSTAVLTGQSWESLVPAVAGSQWDASLS
jgi:hypothetical protein